MCLFRLRYKHKGGVFIDIQTLSTRNSVLTVSDAIASDISKECLYRYVKKNHYEKIGPGIFASPDAFIDELWVLHKRCPNGIISHDEALYFYGLIDREPSAHTVTVFSGYNAKRLKDSGYKVFYVKKDLLALGKQTVIDHFGNELPMYDMERTIVDLVRNRSQFETQDFLTALKSYVLKSDKNLSKLSSYAKILHVDKLIRQYLEVLL